MRPGRGASCRDCGLFRCRRSQKELIAWLKTSPGKASAATVGAGSAAHVCLLYFQQKTGTSFQLVPYRGGAPVMPDLVAGQIDMFCAVGPLIIRIQPAETRCPIVNGLSVPSIR